MEAAVTVAVIVFVIVAGMFLIHRINVQHGAGTEGFRYRGALPGGGRRNRKGPRATASKGPPADAPHRERREGSKGAP
ncbi:hypothetical protein HUT18_18485 [Streptomyces sp. NA04227]|uniref:hypothetical protein n=1 Tax=Streptomyces sp. NA04227 TaxID=2742136 RepID=UPI0015917000|nr:hypothetical protein [Streptomyces sp. NA04227]QKW08074.1 hypothetical protein HUT18_18485 [Streptomyces sp. NA04227]